MTCRVTLIGAIDELTVAIENVEGEERVPIDGRFLDTEDEVARR